MLTKFKVLQTVNTLPETFSFEEVMDQLLLLQKIENGIIESNEGKTLSTSEAKSKLKKWLK